MTSNDCKMSSVLVLIFDDNIRDKSTVEIRGNSGNLEGGEEARKRI